MTFHVCFRGLPVYFLHSNPRRGRCIINPRWHFYFFNFRNDNRGGEHGELRIKRHDDNAMRAETLVSVNPYFHHKTSWSKKNTLGFGHRLSLASFFCLECFPISRQHDFWCRLNNLARRLVKKSSSTFRQNKPNFQIVQVEQDLSLKSQTPLWIKYLVKSVQ